MSDKTPVCWKCGKKYECKPEGDRTWGYYPVCDCPAYYPEKVRELEADLKRVKNELENSRNSHGEHIMSMQKIIDELEAVHDPAEHYRKKTMELIFELNQVTAELDALKSKLDDAPVIKACCYRDTYTKTTYACFGDYDNEILGMKLGKSKHFRLIEIEPEEDTE